MRRRWGWKTVPRGIGVGKADLFRFDLASSVWFVLVWFVSNKPLVSLFNRRQNARAGDGAMVLDARA
jgi:hypothetical protein